MDAKQQIAQILETAGVQYVARHVGETVNPFGERDGKPVTMDKWEIIFSRADKVFTLDFFTGLGWRKKPANTWAQEKPVKPAAADVLHSVALDASACDESFEDWAANYGYDTDSRRALETYLSCQKHGTAYRRLIDHAAREQIETILQDY